MTPVRFAESYVPPPRPEEDVLVWELKVPAEAEGAVAALCDGYEYKLQLRSKTDGRPGSFAAWVAPGYRREIEDLLTALRRRYGVAATGPRPFRETDFVAGMHVAPRREGRP